MPARAPGCSRAGAAHSQGEGSRAQWSFDAETSEDYRGSPYTSLAPGTGTASASSSLETNENKFVLSIEPAHGVAAGDSIK